MEERKQQQDLERLNMARNPSSIQSLPNAFRAIPMVENQRLSILSPANNHVNRLPSLPVNRSQQLPLHENFNPHHANVAMNPNYPDSFYDSLKAAFNNKLNLSSPLHQTSPADYGGGSVGGRVGSILPVGAALGKIGDSIPSNNNNINNSYIDNNPIGMAQLPFSYEDLQRMRVESAVRGQLAGMYIQPKFAAIPAQELDNLRFRNGSVFHPDLGGVFPADRYNTFNNNDFQRRERSRSFDVFDYDNSSSSLSSSFHRCRQQRQNSSSSLEELRSKIFSSLEELRGKIFIVAKDKNGCRDLQKIFAEGKPEEKEIIFSELKDHARELMVDLFGNYLMQKMFEVGSPGEITELLLLITNDERRLMAICVDMHGTRAMQKLLEHLTTPDQRRLLVSALRSITVTLIKSSNGHHVVEHILKYFPNDDKKDILNVVADNCLDIATDKSGCCVLQQCVEHARGEALERLFAEIIANALVLSQHPYGNYVVQFIVGLRNPHITRDILAQLNGNYVSLSMDKYGSNVVEKCMKESSEEQAKQIINEIIGSQSFLTVLQDPFGNYVAQSAFAIAKGSIRHAMSNLIQMHCSYLHSHPHGKRVLARARGTKQQRL